MHLKPIHDTLGTPLKGVTAAGGQRVLQFYLFTLFFAKFVLCLTSLSLPDSSSVGHRIPSLFGCIILSSLYKYVVHFLITFLNSIKVSQTHDIFCPLHHGILLHTFSCYTQFTFPSHQPTPPSQGAHFQPR